MERTVNHHHAIITRRDVVRTTSHWATFKASCSVTDPTGCVHITTIIITAHRRHTGRFHGRMRSLSIRSLQLHRVELLFQTSLSTGSYAQPSHDLSAKYLFYRLSTNE
jgi:hypothetical protein